MFDARSLLENLVRGPAQSSQSQSADPAAELGDLLRQFTQGGPQQGGQQSSGGDQQQPNLNDLLGNLFPGANQAQAPQAAPSEAQGGQSSGGGLGDIFGQLQKHMQPSGGSQPAQQPSGQGGGSPIDILGQIFGQATQGAQEGAGRIGESTGLNQIIEQMSGGRSPQELLDQVKQYMSENKLGTGAAIGGLGALILGTQTGRSVAATAAKIGAAALIGGLAYKAYQNYQQGRPLVSGATEAPQAAPAGSGFEEEQISNDGALTMIRAMIAAAAADGRIDAAEQQAIIGNLKGAGLDSGAEEFLAQELNSPASIDALAAGAANAQEAIKIYTAARISIDPDTGAEQNFLYNLGARLGLDEELMAHIDAQARAAA